MNDFDYDLLEEYLNLLGLELEDNPSKIKIKSAYRKLIAKNHPDKVAKLDEDIQELALNKTQELNEAYDFISNNFKKIYEWNYNESDTNDYSVDENKKQSHKDKSESSVSDDKPRGNWFWGYAATESKPEYYGLHFLIIPSFFLFINFQDFSFDDIFYDWGDMTFHAILRICIDWMVVYYIIARLFGAKVASPRLDEWSAGSAFAYSYFNGGIKGIQTYFYILILSYSVIYFEYYYLQPIKKKYSFFVAFIAYIGFLFVLISLIGILGEFFPDFIYGE